MPGLAGHAAMAKAAPAITATTLTSGSSTTDTTGGYTTASVALSANKLYLLAFATKRDAGAQGGLTATQTGATWTQVHHASWGSTNVRMTVFRCQPTADVAAATIAIDNPDPVTNTWGVWVLVEVSGCLADPRGNGTEAIIQALVSNDNSGTGPSIALSTFAHSANVGIGFFLHDNSSSVMTPAATYADAGNTVIDTTVRLAAVSKINGATPAVTASGTGNWLGIAIEVDASGRRRNYDQTIFADAPSGYWRCADTGPGTQVWDASGNLRHLTRGGNAAFNAAKVHPQGLRAFDFPAGAAADHLEIADAAWQSPHAGASGKMSLECWVRFDSLATIRTMFWKGLASNFEYSFCVLTDGSVNFDVFTAAGGTAGTLTSAAGVITTATVYYLAATWDRAADQMHIYRNGIEVAAATTIANSTDGTAPLCFGFRDSLDDRILDGQASHLGLYPVALSQLQVAAHYVEGVAA